MMPLTAIGAFSTSRLEPLVEEIDGAHRHQLEVEVAQVAVELRACTRPSRSRRISSRGSNDVGSGAGCR